MLDAVGVSNRIVDYCSVTFVFAQVARNPVAASDERVAQARKFLELAEKHLLEFEDLRPPDAVQPGL